VNVAIIPARGGSKRIPRKNIRPFHGKPIIGWSIEAARESGCFERVIVSTDDAEIAGVAREFGAETPFVRPAELADDIAPTGVVMAHAVGWCRDAGLAVERACCLYATAPFVTAVLIRDGLARLDGADADYAVSATSFPFPIQRACRIRDGRLEMIDPANYLVRSQDLEEAFHDAGQLYWGRADAWSEGRPIFGERTVPVLMPRHRVQDIDTPEDWRRAELLFGLLMDQGEG
jgi:N-acylneuraminate cytidylyltransferase